jgi:hypothetical protein
MVTIGDLGCDLNAYPNLQRWLANMKKLKNWDTVNEVFAGFAAANKGKEFVGCPEFHPHAPPRSASRRAMRAPGVPRWPAPRAPDQAASEVCPPRSIGREGHDEVG